MTDHDQDAAIGALTKRYSEAKRTRAALVAAIGKHREALKATERALQNISPGIIAASVPTLPTYPDHTILATLLADLRTAATELEHAQALLKEAGLDVS